MHVRYGKAGSQDVEFFSIFDHPIALKTKGGLR
jgi:hypothetical protein